MIQVQLRRMPLCESTRNPNSSHSRAVQESLLLNIEKASDLQPATSRLVIIGRVSAATLRSLGPL